MLIRKVLSKLNNYFPDTDQHQVGRGGVRPLPRRVGTPNVIYAKPGTRAGTPGTRGTRDGILAGTPETLGIQDGTPATRGTPDASRVESRATHATRVGSQVGTRPGTPATRGVGEGKIRGEGRGIIDFQMIFLPEKENTRRHLITIFKTRPRKIQRNALRTLVQKELGIYRFILFLSAWLYFITLHKCLPDFTTIH